MEKVIITTSKTEKGFCASCDLLPGWVVAFLHAKSSTRWRVKVRAVVILDND
jgi:hypothetical protein